MINIQPIFGSIVVVFISYVSNILIYSMRSQNMQKRRSKLWLLLSANLTGKVVLYPSIVSGTDTRVKT